MSLTKKERQQIVDDFVERHGKYEPEAFVEEVAATRGQHPAWTWFTWDNEKAAQDHRIWQARTFVHGLRITYDVELTERGKIKVRQVESPFVFSPIHTRGKGGGYVELDPQSPESMGLFCDEAASSLETWLQRYNGAVAYAGGSVKQVEKLIGLLKKKSMPEEAA